MKRITETLARSAVSICVSFFYLDITVESQGHRLLSIQDAKQPVEQFELRTHSRFSVYKKKKMWRKRLTHFFLSCYSTVKYF